MSAVNDVSADVVSVCGPPDTRSSGLQFIAADTTPRDGARQTGEHSNLLMYDTAARSRASSPHLIICKHLDDNEDAGDEENDDSDCSGIGGPESSPHHRTLATVSANGMQYASSQRS